jgi:hypothetical protein
MGSVKAGKGSYFTSNGLRYFYTPFQGTHFNTHLARRVLVEGSFVFEKFDTIDNQKAFLLKGSMVPANLRAPGTPTTRIWVSPDEAFMLLRWETVSAGGESLARVDVVRTEVNDGVAYPAAGRSWVRSPDVRGRDEEYSFSVTSIAFHLPLTTEDFRFEWPPRTVVRDLLEDRTFLVAEKVQPPAQLRESDIDRILRGVKAQEGWRPFRTTSTYRTVIAITITLVCILLLASYVWRKAKTRRSGAS